VILTGRTPAVTGRDARAALSMARAAIQSITTASSVRIDELKDQ
jgi:myo-inositol 2-dehydrogenase / D-chiro-inositol 1-dehydrogenase